MKKIRHVPSLHSLTKDEILHVLNISADLKKELKTKGANRSLLERKTLAMIFQKTSTRTRISFETAMTQLGGHAIFIDSRTTQIGMSELADEAKVVSRYVDFIMARLLRHSDLEVMMEASEVPVINGLTEKYHPCQILADLLTLQEKLGNLEGKKLVYMGIANNVSNDLTIGCTKVGMHFTLCVPERHPISQDDAFDAYIKGNKRYSEEPDPYKAIRDADAVYTDTWIDMEFFNDPTFAKEKNRRLKTFLPYQVNEKLLKGSNTLVMHDMPMHIGYEISRGTADSKNSIIFDQAENRLHAQKGLLVWLTGPDLVRGRTL